MQLGFQNTAHAKLEFNSLALKYFGLAGGKAHTRQEKRAWLSPRLPGEHDCGVIEGSWPGNDAKRCLHVSSSINQDHGFTLLEVLISLTIVALTVTVYFQLISAGMKLEYRSGQKVDAAIRAQQVFEELKTCDVREDDFQWQGEDRKCTWRLEIWPEDVQTLEMEGDSPALKKETELYMYVFRYACPEDKEIVLRRLVVVSPDFFSDQFKKEHMGM